MDQATFNGAYQKSNIFLGRLSWQKAKDTKFCLRNLTWLAKQLTSVNPFGPLCVAYTTSIEPSA